MLNLNSQLEIEDTLEDELDNTQLSIVPKAWQDFTRKPGSPSVERKLWKVNRSLLLKIVFSDCFILLT